MGVLALMEARVAVVGGGLMGHGIAQVFATAGHHVVVVDTNAEILRAVPDRISASLAELGIESGTVLGRIELSSSLTDAVRNCDVVIEAATEKLAIKRAIFKEVAQAAPAHALMGSNTSTIPITEIGQDLDDDARSRLVGLHFWFPPVLIPLVEVVWTEFLTPENFDRAFQLMKSVGKQPVRVNRDIPGFIGNRLLHSLNREALSMVNSGVCDAETIDKVIKLSFGRRFSVLGPMEGIDMVGLELVKSVHGLLFPFLDNSTESSPLLDRLIEQNKHGMRTGEGLRKWTPEEIAEAQTRLSAHLISFARNEKR
jgi:3-hydroxybutyryl-CoA dehydrogenase